MIIIFYSWGHLSTLENFPKRSLRHMTSKYSVWNLKTGFNIHLIRVQQLSAQFKHLISKPQEPITVSKGWDNNLYLWSSLTIYTSITVVINWGSQYYSFSIIKIQILSCWTISLESEAIIAWILVDFYYKLNRPVVFDASGFWGVLHSTIGLLYVELESALTISYGSAE